MTCHVKPSKTKRILQFLCMDCGILFHMVIISLSVFLSYSLHSDSQQIHLFLPFRKYNFKYKEENKHGDATRNQRYQYIIYCRRNQHPQIVQSVADQRNHSPCDEIPGFYSLSLSSLKCSCSCIFSFDKKTSPTVTASSILR